MSTIENFYWEQSSNSFKNSSGRVVARGDAGHDGVVDYEAKFDDIRDTTAAEFAAALVLRLESSEKIANDRYAAINVRFNAADIGIVRTAWARSYPNLDPDMVSVEFRDGILVQSSEIIVPTGLGFGSDQVISCVGPYLEGLGMEVVEVHLTGHDPGVGTIDVSLPVDMRFEQMAYTSAVLRDLCMNTLESPKPDLLFRAIRAGESVRILGMVESDVLDVKRAHYSKEDEKKRLDLAVDVAAFANHSMGGILIIGASTVTDAHGREVISNVHGCEIDRGAEVRYRSALDSLIFPGVDRIDMCRARADRGEVFAILIPPQSEADRPFIVRGGYSATGKVNSASFQVPLRRGDSNRSLRIEQVHRYLSGLQ